MLNPLSYSFWTLEGIHYTVWCSKNNLIGLWIKTNHRRAKQVTCVLAAHFHLFVITPSSRCIPLSIALHLSFAGFYSMIPVGPGNDLLAKKNATRIFLTPQPSQSIEKIFFTVQPCISCYILIHVMEKYLPLNERGPQFSWSNDGLKHFQAYHQQVNTLIFGLIVDSEVLHDFAALSWRHNGTYRRRRLPPMTRILWWLLVWRCSRIRIAVSWKLTLRRIQRNDQHLFSKNKIKERFVFYYVNSYKVKA